MLTMCTYTNTQWIFSSGMMEFLCHQQYSNLLSLFRLAYQDSKRVHKFLELQQLKVPATEAFSMNYVNNRNQEGSWHMERTILL